MTLYRRGSTLIPGEDSLEDSPKDSLEDSLKDTGRRPPIRSMTLRDLSQETKGHPKVLRTLAIDHEIPFEQIASGWIFSDTAAETLRRRFKEHCRKCERIGVPPPLMGSTKTSVSA